MQKPVNVSRISGTAIQWYQMTLTDRTYSLSYYRRRTKHEL